MLNNLQSGAVGQSGWKDLGRPAKEQAQTWGTRWASTMCVLQGGYFKTALVIHSVLLSSAPQTTLSATKTAYGFSITYPLPYRPDSWSFQQPTGGSVSCRYQGEEEGGIGCPGHCNSVRQDLEPLIWYIQKASSSDKDSPSQGAPTHSQMLANAWSMLRDIPAVFESQCWLSLHAQKWDK